MPFRNRSDAGRQLAQALNGYRDRKPVVLALPRGGVPVAAEIASAFGAPLDLAIVRKIGVPFQPELAMGAVVNGAKPIVVRNEDIIRHSGISEDEFQRACLAERREIERRRQTYLAGRERCPIEDRVVIVVDDGIATGATVRAALRGLRAGAPHTLVLAVPVAPADTLAALRAEADDIVCLETHAEFGAIGFYYADFRQVSDAEVIDMLAQHAPQGRGAGRVGV